jgi:hypothetical protein
MKTKVILPMIALMLASGNLVSQDRLFTASQDIIPEALLLSSSPAVSSTQAAITPDLSENDPLEMNEPPVITVLNECTISEQLQDCFKSCMSKQMKYPRSAYQDKLEGAVVVKMIFNDEGNMKILQSQSSDPKLLKCVLDRLNHLHIANGFVPIEKEMVYRFLFRII